MGRAISFDPGFKNRGKGKRKGRISVDLDSKNLTGSLNFFNTPELPDSGYLIVGDSHTSKGIDESSATPLFWPATDSNLVEIVNGLPGSRDSVSTVNEAFEYLAKNNYYVLSPQEKNIITDDLVLYVDIANKLSYPGEGIQIYDLANGVKPTSKLRVLGAHHSGYAPPFYSYLNSNATVTNVAVSDITASATYVKENFDLVIVDEFVWSMPTTIIDNMKSYVDVGVSCIGVGNDQRTHYFVESYNTSGRQSHDIVMDSNSRIGLEGQTFTYGSGDVYGGITALKNGAEPLYRRADNDRITGWMYYNEDSGSALYFDQEGLQSTSNEIFRSALNFITKNSLTFGELQNNPTYNSNGWFEFDGTNDDIIIKGSDIFNSDTRTFDVLFQVISFQNGYAHLATFANGTSSSERILLTIQSQKLQWHGWGTDDPNGTTTIETGRWYRGTFTYNKSSGEMKVYTNGTLERTITDTQKTVDGSSVNNWYLGSFGGSTYGDSYSNVKISSFKQYNKILSDSEVAQNYYGGDIVTNGLVLALDAANLVCFEPGSTTCRNLVTGGLVTGANGHPGSGTHTPNTANFPSHNSDYGGIFDFAGGRGMNCDEDLGSSTTRTLVMWFYKNSSSAQYFSDARNNGGQWFLSNYSGENINYTDQMRYNFGGSYNASNSDFLNKWWCMAVVSDSSGSKLYLNGIEVDSYVSQNSIDEDFGKNFRIGTRFTTSSPWTGYFGPIQAYNRVLDPKEIMQNFNAYRSRFSL